MPAKSISKQWLALSICLIIVLAPIPYGANREWASALMYTSTFAVALVWSTSLLFFPRPLSAGVLASRPALAVLFLLQAWIGVQMLWSVDQAATFSYLLLGLCYSFLFLISLDVFSTRQRAQWLFAAIVVSGTIQGFLGAFMVLSGTEWNAFGEKEHYRGVATGTFINRNHLAGMLEISLAASIGWVFALRKSDKFSWHGLVELLQSPKVLIRVAMVIMVIALIMTRSRMGNVAFFFSLMVSGILFIAFVPKNRLRNTLVLISILAIDILIAGQYFGLEQLANRIQATQFTTEVVDGRTITENEQRDNVSEYALKTAERYSPKGSGAGTFEVVFPQDESSELNTHFDHAHNDYLQTWIELGIPGAILMLLFGSITLLRAAYVMSVSKSSFQTGCSLAALIGVTAIAIHSFSDFNLQIPANAMLLTVLCAFAYMPVMPKSRTHW